jgi:hypothetical protein
MPTYPLPDVERPSYFDGQRLTATDLEAAQDYARELRWLHNRSLHGWGIAAGLALTGKRGARTVAVGAGYALDGAGRELVLDRPRTLPVPPVADEELWCLVIAYQGDAAVEERAGDCATSGVVRTGGEPLLRWISDPPDEGLELVLATATIAGCKLAHDLAFGERRALVRAQPYVAAGTTPACNTPWRLWPDESQPAGLVTTVPTGAAGFRSTPSYQARVSGDRFLGTHYYDGFASIANASASSFDLRLLMPASTDALQLAAVSGTDYTLNPIEDFQGLAPSVGNDLCWYVVWMGVEA